MDYEQLRVGLAGAIPLNKHLGLEVVEVADGRGVVRLPDAPHLLNHVGSQHAAALFAAGEAASGAAMVGALADQLAGLTPLASQAQISYKRVARGVITATAALSEPPTEIIARIERDGRAEFDAAIDLTDAEERTVATMTVRWHISSRKA